MRSRWSLGLEIVAVAASMCLVGALHVSHCLSRPLVMAGDVAKHFITAAGMCHGLAQSPTFAERARWALSPAVEYPSGPYLGTCAAFHWLGITGEAAVLGQIPWVLITVLAVYLFVRRQAGIAPAAAAALLVATSPIISSATVHYAPDMMLTAASFVAIALLASDFRFERRTVSLALGIALGASLLAKWTCVATLGLPMLVTGLAVMAASPRAGRFRFLLLVGLLIAGTLGIPRLTDCQPLPTQAWALVVTLPLAGLALLLLRREDMRRLANLFLALLVAWATSLGVYTGIARRLTERFWTHVQYYKEVRVDEGFVQAHLLVCGLLAVSFLLPLGLLHLWQARRPLLPVHVVALALVGGAALTVGAFLPFARYYAPLVPLAAVLCTWWWPRTPRWVQVGLLMIPLAAVVVHGRLLATTRPPTDMSLPLRHYAAVFTSVDESEDGSFTHDWDTRARAAGVLTHLQRRVGTDPAVVCLLADGPRNASLLPCEAWEALAVELGYPLPFVEMELYGNTTRVKAHPWNQFDLARHPRSKGHTNAETGLPMDAMILLAPESSPHDWGKRLKAGTGQEWRVVQTLAWTPGTTAFLLLPR